MKWRRPPPQRRRPSSAMEESRNWVEMPDEVMANILKRLGTKQILRCAWRVCTTWRRICKDPAMWKVIDIPIPVESGDSDSDLERLTKQAIDLSCGESIDISIKYFGTDDLLDYIVLSSSKLKCLGLINCCRVTHSGLIRTVKRVPQLEKFTCTLREAEDIAVIGRNCPHLKSFKMEYTGNFCNLDAIALAIANNMPKLCHLKVDDMVMSNERLQAILNGCPHLQSLDLRKCSNVFNEKLVKLCMERIKDFKYRRLF